MREVEKEAFPEQWPPSRFSREIGKANSLYLVAVRPRTPDEITRVELERRRDGVAAFGSRVLSGLGVVARTVGLLGVQREGKGLAFPDYVLGFAGAWFVADETHLVAIGARAEERRKGIADLLLLGVTGEAISLGCREVTLEVRQSNAAARALYSKHGFREVGMRKRYYSDNGEDAVIMTTPPIQSDAYGRTLASLARDHAARWGVPDRLPA